MVLTFLIYATLPSSWVPSRNNNLIFGQIGFLFAINQFVQAIWLPIWINSKPVTFIFAGVINAIMLVTGLAILQYTMEAKLNTFECIFLRGGFSIYVGWLSAANIIGIAMILYSSGLQSNQVMWTKVILVVAYIIYAAYAFIERNPLFGLIFIWVLLSVRENSQERYPEIATLSTILMIVHWVTLAAVTGLCIYEMGNKTLTHGLFF